MTRPTRSTTRPRTLWYRALAVLFALGLSASAQAQCKKDSSPEKDADVLKLLEISGTAAISEEIFKQTIDTYKNSMPQVPDAVWASVEAQTNASGLTVLLAPVYACHLTHEEIKGIIAFYESPAGIAFAKALPAISDEAHAAGQRWAVELGQQVVKGLRDAGY